MAESLLDQFAVLRLAPDEDKIVFFVPEGDDGVEAVTPSSIRVKQNRGKEGFRYYR